MTQGVLGSVFFLSGTAALVYQVVWQRVLTLHYGVGAVSTTLVVAVFMLGLGIGGGLGGWLADRVRRPIVWYVGIELALAALGAASLPILGRLGADTAAAAAGVGAGLAFAFLAAPTTLMGATLPLVVKCLAEGTGAFSRTVSLLYAVNTLGAAAGAVLAAYGLISFGGLDVAVAVAAATNASLALLLVFAGLRRGVAPIASPAGGTSVAERPASSGHSGAVGGSARIALALVFATGFLALGYELVWIRLVGVLIKASPYAFATVLAVYLFGIAAGSLAMRSRIEGLRDPRSLFLLLQALLGASVILTISLYYQATLHTGLAALTRASFAGELYPPPDLFASPARLLEGLAGVVSWPAWFVLLPSALMGASFPLAARLAYAGTGTEGRTIGGVYVANLAGNVAGALVTGLLVLPRFGTERTLLAFAAVGGLAILGVRVAAGARLSMRARGALALAALSFAWLAFPARGELYRAMHAPGFSPPVPSRTLLGEGLEGVVLSYEAWPRMENYINGLGHGVRPPHAFWLEAVEALSRAHRLERVLVIGFGTGGIVEAVQRSDAQRITLVELNDTLLRQLARVAPLREILEDPRNEIVVDDARRFLLRSERSFDLVLMDPLRTTTAYSNNLYSVEFFELVRSHLAPDGVLLVWTDELRVLPRTVAEVFPHAELWNFFVLASPSPLKADPIRRAELLRRYDAAERRGIASVDARHLGDHAAILARNPGALVNRDWRPVGEYYLGRHRRHGPSGTP